MYFDTTYILNTIDENNHICFLDTQNSLTILSGTSHGSIDVNGDIANCYYGEIRLEVTAHTPTNTHTYEPINQIKFGHKSSITSFNNNILLIHDYCEIDRALKHYYYNQSTSDCETCFCRDVTDSTRVDY